MKERIIKVADEGKKTEEETGREGREKKGRKGKKGRKRKKGRKYDLRLTKK